MLFGVTPPDGAIYAAGIGLIIAVIAVASFIPARHAAYVELLTLLRD